MPADSLFIYHIAERSTLANDDRTYVPAGFDREGFVHCSRWSQLAGVARALFADRADLVVLEIDTSRLDSEVRYEDLYDAGRPFPHVYGPIERSAITATLDVAWPLPGEPRFARAGAEPSPEALVVRRGRETDVDALARMNHALREDEGYSDAIPVPRLKARLREWLADGYESWVLELPPAGPIGYVLVDPARDPLYLRQLFVARGARRAGLGREAVNELLEHYEATHADVDALVDNEPARRFWRGLGFEERAVGMRWRARDRESAGRPAPGGEAEPAASPAEAHLAVFAGETREAAAWILDGLKAFNDAHSPHHRALREAGGSEPLAVMLTDEAGHWVGGVCGSVHWGWLHVDDFWVSRAYRGRGHGRELLGELERQAATRGATRAQLSTFHFQARGMYEKLGYRVVGEMVDLPPGGAMYWMRKDGLG